jgi:hypothetical protein
LYCNHDICGSLGCRICRCRDCRQQIMKPSYTLRYRIYIRTAVLASQD